MKPTINSILQNISLFIAIKDGAQIQKPTITVRTQIYIQRITTKTPKMDH